jgi:hypothetical protein
MIFGATRRRRERGEGWMPMLSLLGWGCPRRSLLGGRRWSWSEVMRRMLRVPEDRRREEGRWGRVSLKKRWWW